MEGWLRFVFARRCINIYFEQTEWQQAADAKWYLSSIIYVFFFPPTLYLCLHLSRSTPPTLYALHKGVHKHTHWQWGTQWLHPQRNCMNAHTIAFSFWQKLAHWLHRAKWHLLSFSSLLSAYKETQLKHTHSLTIARTHTFYTERWNCILPVSSIYLVSVHS